MLEALTLLALAPQIAFQDLGGTTHDLGAAIGGVAVIDFDDDGWQDVLVGNGSGSLRLYRNVAAGGPAPRTFQDVTAGSGFNDADATGRDTIGIVVADVDGDGRDDVFVSGWQSATGTVGLLYKNLGGGQFQNVSVASGARVAGYRSLSNSAVDYDHDGDIDLFQVCFQYSTSNYLLLENDGHGQFTSVSAPLPTHTQFYRAYTHAWTDLDLDGWEDCVILVDASAPRLLHNESDGAGGRRLVDVAAAWGFSGLGTFPMGIASGDFDNDGDFDLALSNANDGKYFRNDGPGVLTAITPFVSVWGWGVAWIDGENDGDLDLYMAGSWPNPVRDKLFENLGGGTFVDSSTALGAGFLSSRYSAAIDIENDGRVDLVTVNPGGGPAPVSVFANQSTNAGHWIGFELAGGNGVNPDALGAIVRVTAGGVTRLREVKSGSSTTSSEDLRLAFGLGAATSVDLVEVTWPRLGLECERVEVFPGPFAVDAYHTLAPGTTPRTSGFCFGDGGVAPGCTPCPCANDAPPGAGGGCANAAGTSARLLPGGCARISADSLRFELDRALPASFAVLTSGAARAPDNPANVCFGLDSGVQSFAFDGLRCVVGAVRRHGSRATDAAGAVGATNAGWGPPSGPAGGLLAQGGFAVGQTRHWQAIYRTNPASGCGRGQNTTQGATATIAP